MMEQQLSFNRLWLLIRREFLLERPVYSFFTLSFFITFFVIWLVSPEKLMYQSMFGYFLFIWGICATSWTFRSLHNKTSKEAYLLLPASTLEKFLSHLLPLTLGMGIILPIFFVIISAVIETLSLAIFGTNRPLFNPFDSQIIELYVYYLFVQPFFFLGAIWFSRLMLLKTLFTLIVLMLGFVLIVLLSFSVAAENSNWQHWNERSSYSNDQGSYSNMISDHYYSSHLRYYKWFKNRSFREFDTQITIVYIVIIVLPFVLLWIAWLRLKEVQVSDGI